MSMIILASLFSSDGPQLPNTPPSVVPDTFTTNINTAVTVNVLTNDIAGSVAIDPTTVEVFNATNGTAVANASGQVVFTPTTGYTGTGAFFEYDVADINGLRSPQRAQATGTVQAVATPPSDIIETETVSVAYTAPVDTKVAKLAINQGVGTGAWARTSGSTKLKVSAATGASINILIAAALVAADKTAGLSAVFSYSGDPGQVGSLTETVAITVTDPPAATGLVLTTPTPIRLANTANSGAVVANVRLDPVGSVVAGTFSKVSGFAKFAVNATTGRVTLNADLVPADNGSARNVVVRYTPTSGTAPPDLTISVEIFTPVATSGRLDGFCVNFNGPTDAPLQLNKVASLLGFPNGKPQVVLVNSGVHKDYNAWVNFPASLRSAGNDTPSDQGLYIRILLDSGILPVINFPVTVNDRKNSSGTVIERHAGMWSEVNGGDYDAGIDLTATRLKAIANGRLVVVRLGWEMTLDRGQFPWSVQWDSSVGFADSKNAFNRVVNRVAAIFGSAPVLFDWCPHKDQKYTLRTYDLSDIFPSSLQGEHMSIDFYDAGSEVSTDYNVAGGPADYGVRNATGATALKTFRGKLDRVRMFADTKNCTFGVDEWGLRDDVSNQGGSDNPFFVENMYRYCTDEAVRWQIYFRIDRGIAGNGGAVVSPPDDAVHAMVHNEAGGPVIGGPWKGTALRANPNSPATAKGQLVGTGQPGATGLAGARFKTLFGQGGSL